MSFQCYMPVRVLGGEDAVARNAKLLAGLGGSCLIVTGARSARLCGAWDDVTRALEQNGISYRAYQEIGENPSYESCERGAALAREMGAAFVLGIGGGSPLDAAKAIAALAANPGMPWQDLFALAWKNRPLPTALVGTTSGTGSEVTPTAVITDPTGRKRGVSHPDLYAALSFADPRYTYLLPRQVTVSTGLDALSHATEGFLSPLCGDAPAAYARQALPVLCRELSALAHGAELTPRAHAALYEASLWAGLVLNETGTAYPHPYGYVLTEEYGVPHGRACAAFLPALLERAEKYTPERAQAYLDAAGLSREEWMSMLSVLNRPLPKIPAERIDALLPRFENLKHYRNVPGGCSAQEGVRLFRALFL